MNFTTSGQPFPCPFCHSTHVELLGGGLVFLHYQCGDCAEVWTAMAAPRPAIVRPRSAPANKQLTPRITRKEKFWPN
jgi:hypothetical protein